MKKVFISGFVAMSLVMFSFANPTNTGINNNTTEQNPSSELIAGNGNNNCTPNVENYDYNFSIPIPPGVFQVNLVCIDEPLYLTEINLHAWGKAVRSASCHVNDKGTQEENTYFLGTETGDIYQLNVTSSYHSNYNFTFEGGVFSQQGAYVSMNQVSGEITNMTTGEVIPVTISSRFVANANGTPTVDQYELNCE